MASSAPTVRYRAASRSSTLPLRLLAWLASWLLGVLLVAALIAWRYDGAYQGRIVEGVSVNGVALGGLSPAQAEILLQSRLPAAGDERLTLHAGGQRWTASARELGVYVDASATAQAAMGLGREGSVPQQWRQRLALWRGSAAGLLAPTYTRDPAAVEALLARIANEVARDPQDALLTVQGLSASATPALPGQQLDLDGSRAMLLQALAERQPQVELLMVERPPHIVGAEEAAQKAEALLSTPLVLTFNQRDFVEVGAGQFVPAETRRQWMVERARLAEMLLLFSRPLDSGQYAWDVRLKPELLRAEMESIAAAVSRPARDARFDFDPNSGTLTPLVVSQEGLRLDVEPSMVAVEQAIAQGSHEVALAVTVLPPQVSTADAAQMNISGLATRGFSDYSGSSYEREVNVGVAANQYHGLVIPPGAEFSFNDHLGWVVDANGYEEGYIIAGNKTEVDVGGGVCQVSTTMFRAAFNAGFPITERHAHAYRVPYYENGSPLGWDATIFSPYVDFKFRNDTTNYYLIEVENDSDANTLAILLYGPPTGRRVDIFSTVTDTAQPDAPIYEDDPTLPQGTVEQVDWEHEGATIRVDRVIYDANSGAEVGRDTFWSYYEPWRARFLRGTGN